jgi:DNA-binding response OmpR family regulator
MLTARGDVSDRIRGLDAGADDYLVKPFDFGELLARLRALFRRGATERGEAIEVRDLRIDPATRVVTRAGHQIELTARELAVLEVLARHAGQVVSRAQLLEEVWREQYDGSQNVVDVYVGYVRKKLELPSDDRSVIRTVRGIGFVLEAD